jgi:alkylhydroperoxidase/carboxymuconolactone decarboxylase family protein YurZ
LDAHLRAAPQARAVQLLAISVLAKLGSEDPVGQTIAAALRGRTVEIRRREAIRRQEVSA